MDKSDRIAGNGASDTNKHAPTPMVKTAPRLYRPRWAETIKLPNPTIVEVAVNTIAFMILGDVWYTPSGFA